LACFNNISHRQKGIVEIWNTTGANCTILGFEEGKNAVDDPKTYFWLPKCHKRLPNKNLLRNFATQ
jgi:hypothetical protein